MRYPFFWLQRSGFWNAFRLSECLPTRLSPTGVSELALCLKAWALGISTKHPTFDSQPEYQFYWMTDFCYFLPATIVA
jgi:hypothetical protein